MTELWVSIILFTFSLSGEIDQHFKSKQLCWEFYEKHPLLYRQIDEAFPKDYYVRLYQNDEHGLVWITCNKLSDLRGNDSSKFPLNVPLPTPESKK
jgi:hypothetical protein|tara:strand:+ start:75 stop:362 length:288 start_codon:yes stop_codon:yes gene_type:complete